jgi:hypothetical protein
MGDLDLTKFAYFIYRTQIFYNSDILALCRLSHRRDMAFGELKEWKLWIFCALISEPRESVTGTE